MLSLCITIPVYNEELRLEKGVRRLWTFLQENKIQARIDIADNGSQDRTRELARKLSAELAGVTLTEVPRKGVGLALKTSWDAAKEDLVSYMDVDLSTELRHLPEALQILQNAPQVQAVNGSRLKPGAKVIGRKLIREITSRGFNFLLRTALSSRISDGMCGFKFIRRPAYLKLRQAGLQRDDWFFNTEILVRAEWEGFQIEEIPVQWEDDPNSKVDIFKLSQSYWSSILALRRERVRK